MSSNFGYQIGKRHERADMVHPIMTSWGDNIYMETSCFHVSEVHENIMFPCFFSILCSFVLPQHPNEVMVNANEGLSSLSRTECTEVDESIFIGTDGSCRLSTNKKLWILSGLTGVVTILRTLQVAMFCYVSLRASEVLHNRMVMAILRAPVHFFDMNPIGEPLPSIGAH